MISTLESCLVEFINYVEGYVLYSYKEQWYKVPFFVLEEFTNDFFLDWYNRPIGTNRSKKLRKLLNGNYNNPKWNSPGPSAGKLLNQMPSSPTIRLFKCLFRKNIESDFKAYEYSIKQINF